MKTKLFNYSETQYDKNGKRLDVTYFGRFSSQKKFMTAILKEQFGKDFSDRTSSNWIRERLSESANGFQMRTTEKKENKLFKSEFLKDRLLEVKA